MARPFSDDLRRRILQAYEQGEGTQAQLAQRFRVSLDYVRKIHRQWRHTGKMERVPHRAGPQAALHRADSRAAAPLAEAAAGPDASGVAGKTESGGPSRSERTFAVDGAQKDGPASEKKSLHARERDTEANRQRRAAFLEKLGTIAPEKLIFLDESGVTTQMTRAWGRAPKGERIAEATPQGHWQGADHPRRNESTRHSCGHDHRSGHRR